MKYKLLSLIIIFMTLFASLGANYTIVNAYAYETDFVTTVHYQNIGTGTAQISLTIYDQSGATEFNGVVSELAPNASTSLYIGTLGGLASDFSGSAVLSSNQPLASTVAQIGSGDVVNQPLSNGFSIGSSSVLIPTVLKNMFRFTSVFSVQNVDSVAADLTFTFVPVTGSAIIHNVNDLAAYASYYVDMGTFSGISADTFNGSVKIESVRADTTTPGSIVATSMELQIDAYNAYAFNGASSTGTKIYMPSALCKYGPNNESTSAYAVQNTTDGNVDVTVTYSNGNVDGPYTLESYAKRSFDGCQAGNEVGFLGSATVTATGGNIHAVGKVYGGGVYPAYLGFIDGSAEIALPFARWTEDNWFDGTGQRSYIAVQNIGTTDIDAGDVTVKYYDKNGTLVGTHSLGAIPVGGKQNSHPQYVGATEFGTYSDGSQGGGAIVEGPSGSKLAVIVRIQKYLGDGNLSGEDYEGIPMN